MAAALLHVAPRYPVTPKGWLAGGETYALGYADDLVGLLADEQQLVRFKELLAVYERGSGAENDWAEKTAAIRVGTLKSSTTMPVWDGPSELQLFGRESVIRYLGVFLGTPSGVAREWEKRTAAAEPPLDGKSARTVVLQLKVVNPTEGGTLITLPSSEFERLGLQPGSRVRVRKMKPAALWSSVPDQAIGEAAVADPKMDAGVRLTVADMRINMRMLHLRVGENVLVAPMPFVSVPSAAAATRVNTTATSKGQNELEMQLRVELP